MTFPCRRTHSLFIHPIWVSVLLVCALCSGAQAQNVVLYLKGGDRISGRIVSEYTNRIVLSNSWTKELSVPLDEIVQREIILTKGTNHVSSTHALTKLKLPLPPATPPPLFKHWKGEAEVGFDMTDSTTDQRNYHGRFKLSYEHPYVSNPTNFFRNSIDYEVAYGKTIQRVDSKKTTTTSSDRMGASDKTTMDFDHRWYGYNLAGVGYDRVRNIDLFGEEGPGLGYHLLTRSNLVANVESGVDYQIQYNSDQTHSRDFFFRVAEDVTWKLTPRTSFSQKAEFFPRVNFEEYRLRAEATLSYNLWRYVYWNTTVRDNYDTTPAAKVQGNEFEINSALGVKF
jgi:putative salt-induced outer membrane protein YdiY